MSIVQLVVAFAVTVQSHPFNAFAPIIFNNDDHISPGTVFDRTAGSIPIILPGEQYPAANFDVGLPDVSTGDNRCNIRLGEAYYKGNCLKLLRRGPCDFGYWLVINREDGSPTCKKKTCPHGMIIYGDRCIPISATDVCPEGEILYLDFAGHASCDCEPEFIFDKNSQRCYAENQRGSCAFGFVLSFREQHVSCVENPCQREDLIYNNGDGLCYVKQYVGNCTAEIGRSVDFNMYDGTAQCFEVGLKSIFKVPTLDSCPAGSKEGKSNLCSFRANNPKNPFAFRIPMVLTARHSCPHGYDILPNGSCRALNDFLVA